MHIEDFIIAQKGAKMMQGLSNERSCVAIGQEPAMWISTWLSEVLLCQMIFTVMKC